MLSYLDPRAQVGTDTPEHVSMHRHKGGREEKKALGLETRSEREMVKKRDAKKMRDSIGSDDLTWMVS